MRLTFIAPLLALGLAACQTYPSDRYGQGPYGYPEPAPYSQPYPEPYPPQPGYPPYPQPGYPAGPSQGVHNLSNTNWRVVSINGQPMPRTGYYLNFQPDRVSGKFGCNNIGAGYGVTGNILSAGAIMMTRMACPDGSFEAQGTAVMAQPMTITESGDRLTLSNRVGSIELARAR